MHIEYEDISYTYNSQLSDDYNWGESARVYEKEKYMPIESKWSPSTLTIIVKDDLLDQHSKVTIRSTSIYFPFEPYATQIDYMDQGK